MTTKPGKGDKAGKEIKQIMEGMLTIIIQTGNEFGNVYSIQYNGQL